MQFIGWLGAVLFIVAYLLLSLQLISAKRNLYHVLNVLGAVCLVINAWSLRDNPNIVVNAVWGLIALLAIYRRRAEKKKGSPPVEVE